MKTPIFEMVVISGKGGTGKTSVCASLAHLASLSKKPAVLSDLDVDAPDLHIILDPEILQHEEFISGHEAVIRQESCIQCGTCKTICKFDAISLNNYTMTIDPLRCEGCGACTHFCPSKAIDFTNKNCGDWYISKTRFGSFVHAQLKAGEENSGRLVTLLKKEAKALAKKEEKSLIIYDGSPGVGCPVISSLSGVHLALAIVEPTPSGRHDFERIAKLCAHFRIPVALVLNKADLNAEEAKSIMQYSSEQGHYFAGNIPFSEDITKAMVARKTITETDSVIAESLQDIWVNILSYMDQPKKSKNFIIQA